MADPDVDMNHEAAPAPRAARWGLPPHREEARPGREPSRQRDEARPRWGLGDAALGWVLGVVGGFMTLGLAMSLAGVDEVDDLSLGWFALGQTGLWAALLTVSLVAARSKGNGVVADFGLVVRPLDVLVGGVCGLGAQFAIPLLYLPLRLPLVRDLVDVDLEEMERPARELADKAQSGWTIALLVVAVGLVAPVVEEIFYRGLVQRAMQRRFGPWAGISLSALVFGVVHLQPLNIPALTFAGFVFGYLAYRSGRLGPAIAAHVVFNMVTVVVLVSEG